MLPEPCHSIEHRVKNRTTSQKETKTKAANKRGGDQQQYAKGHTEAKKSLDLLF